VKKTLSKYKLSILIVLYLVLLAIGVYFLIMPLIKNLRSQVYQIQAKAIDREAEKKRVEKLPDIEKEWNDYGSQKDALDVILGQADQVSFIENVESIAEKTGNKIDMKIEDNAKSVAFAAKSKDILKEVVYPDYFPIQIDLEGSYPGLINFLHMLENNRFYVDVIAISSTKNSSDIGNQSPFSAGNIIGGSAPQQDNDQKTSQDTIKTEMTVIVYTKKQ